MLGLVLAAASLLGALIVTQLLNRYRPEQLVLAGLGLSVLASVGLIVVASLNQAGWMLVFIFLAFLGLNITLPNALNRALVGYEAIMGSASGWFSLAYYLLVSLLTYLMSWLHHGSIVTLPSYLLTISLAMLGAYYWLMKAKLN
ncbi:bicyclomycin resistance protein [Lactobacillus koreensis] [Lactiplantibacillus mudanjiangensis]|uniref:Bicyclomycin resistance protein [Lactobacillus koreensis] n=1 Tax=Lactiplantibacillus mudanjiangensis TaxID=1296538 RepID=A0A660E654_9LACO|nr:bicyclomycin resistance protein [Lactobacillus koreensis] [Lactiplantibacillus mudanjiangensis]VDG28569.1 bicyclomycin resistance protein [Lactobacillus koreensis] [Lactiplantibacillus mudanjiangensis]